MKESLAKIHLYICNSKWLDYGKLNFLNGRREYKHIELFQTQRLIHNQRSRSRAPENHKEGDGI